MFYPNPFDLTPMVSLILQKGDEINRLSDVREITGLLCSCKEETLRIKPMIHRITNIAANLNSDLVYFQRETKEGRKLHSDIERLNDAESAIGAALLDMEDAIALAEAHREEIALHKAAKAAFNALGTKKLPKIKELNEEYSRVRSEKKSLYADYRKRRKQMQEYTVARKNSENLPSASYHFGANRL